MGKEERRITIIGENAQNDKEVGNIAKGAAKTRLSPS